MNGQVVYDADCGFCTRVATWADVRPVSWQSLGLAEIGATQDRADNFAGWLVDGRIEALGAPAIAAALRARAAGPVHSGG